MGGALPVARATPRRRSRWPRRYDPHVALVDLFVGQESGAEICEQLRARLAAAERAADLRRRADLARTRRAPPAPPGSSPRTGRRADIAGAVRMVGLGMTVFQPHEAPAGPPLSAREREVLELIASGATNREIAGDAVPLAAHDQGAHARALPQARRAQPRRGRAAGAAPRPDRMSASRANAGASTPRAGGSRRPEGRDGVPHVGDGAGVSNADEPAALFPGQGSQTPEMRDLRRAARARRCSSACTELVGEDPFAARRREHPLRPARDLLREPRRLGRARACDAVAPPPATRSASSPRSPPPAR